MSLFIIFVCFSFFGGYLSKQIERRIKKLEKILLLFSHISSRIEFAAQNIGDIFCALEQEKSYDILPFVKGCSALLNVGESFDLAWEKSLNNLENISCLKKEDVGILLSFGCGLGKSDVSGQVSNCQVHKALIEDKLESARKDFAMYSKPLKGIGVLAGTAVIILFI